MFPQPLPSPKQRCHWYANDVGGPVHVPSAAVSVCPACGVPSTLGAPVGYGEGVPNRTS
jgi:hypothetical protein